MRKCCKCNSESTHSLCKSCQKISNKNYYEKNKEYLKKKRREYVNNNKEKIKIAMQNYWIENKEELTIKKKQYYRDNFDKNAAYRALYRISNLELIKEKDRQYKLNNPEKNRYWERNRRARLLGQLGNVSVDIEKILFSKQKGKCACCKGKLKKPHTHLDHIIPLIKGGLHDDKNLQLLCRSCNCSKGAKDPIKFMQQKGYLL